MLRFLGVDSIFTVWLNGVELGWSTGSRLTTEFDVAPYLREGVNVLAVRVHQWSAASYLEDQDQWWLSGIFRSVSLVSRPSGALDDVFVHADFDHETGAGTLRVETDVPALLSVPELGLDRVPADGPHTLGAVEPWSAEQPRLYDATLLAGGETVSLRIGFRTVRVADGLLTVNGRPILIRGVNRHEWNPDRGRSVTAQDMLADVLLMKQHHVNAVRTSHYPPHPDFLDLCDEHGLYVILECDYETHGFFFLDWRGNPSDDPQWQPALLDRMSRTLERDKNHASVILWSLGNEAGHGQNLEAMAALVHGRDPGRPVHYEGDWDSSYVDVYSRMYATHEEVDEIGRLAEPVTTDPSVDAHRRGLPFLQCEYGHAMGAGPGGLLEYQQLFERYPRCQGGFIWEWIDHGIRQHTPDGREFFAYGGDFGEPLHDGSFIADGLLFPDRTPSPGLIEFAAVISPVRLVVVVAAGTVTVGNLRDFADTSDLRFTWAHEVDGLEVAGGTLEVPVVPAQGSVSVAVPQPENVRHDRETWVTVRAVTAGDLPWARAGHVIGLGQAQVGTRVPRAEVDTLLDLGQFDETTGLLARLGSLEVDGPRLDLWRAPTDNDVGTFGPPTAPLWREIGLHRLTHRLVEQRRQGEEYVVVSRVAPAATDLAMLVTYRWTADGDALVLTVEVEPEGTWTVPLPRLGLRMSLPAEITDVEWFGGGPGEAYADFRQAAVVGRYRSTVEDLQTPYVRPQENGNRTGVRWAELRGAVGGVRVEGEPTLELTVRRWTSEELDAADHTTDLVAGDRVHVNLDLAQNGLGTASCGPGVLPQHQLHAGPARWTIRLLPLGATNPARP